MLNSPVIVPLIYSFVLQNEGFTTPKAVNKKITRFIILFILFFLFFSGQTKQDEALDCYGRAANLFKMAKKWSQVIILNFENYMHKTGLAFRCKQGVEGGRGRVNIRTHQGKFQKTC
jgi:hypothetical protein